MYCYIMLSAVAGHICLHLVLHCCHIADIRVNRHWPRNYQMQDDMHASQLLNASWLWLINSIARSKTLNIRKREQVKSDEMISSIEQFANLTVLNFDSV